MSLLDPSDDRPPRSGARRPASATAQRESLTRRRLAAAAIGVAVVVGLVFAVKGCREAQRDRADKDYVRDLASLLQESGQQSAGLFALLTSPGRQGPVDLQNSVNGFSVQADQLADRARREDAPGDMGAAQRFVVETLDFRRDGLAGVARELPTALADRGGAPAAARMAADMQDFLVSDALYARRVAPAVVASLRERTLLGDVTVPSSRFLPTVDWLRPDFVDGRMAALRSGRAPGPGGAGPHGASLGTVAAGGQVLAPGATAHVAGGPAVAFAVQVANRGAAVERDVPVRIAIAGGPRPIEVERRIPELPPGAARTVTIPLAESPPRGRPVPVTVAVGPLPGERDLTNNRRAFTVVFGG